MDKPGSGRYELTDRPVVSIEEGARGMAGEGGRYWG